MHGLIDWLVDFEMTPPCHVAQADFKLLGTRDFPASASQIAELKGMYYSSWLLFLYMDHAILCLFVVQGIEPREFTMNYITSYFYFISVCMYLRWGLAKSWSWPG